ncbi:flotillin family protein [Burkholderia contaminans]|nr:flotillin family protein [Burkholderia contaminans]
MNILDLAAHAAIVLIPILVLAIVVRTAGVVRYVSNSDAAVVERIWSARGSLTSGVIALNGEAGLLPDLLRGGIHIFRPYSYRLHHQPIPVVPNNELGYVFARSGLQLPPSQALASNETANQFEDVRAFLEAGGQKGLQRLVLRGGVHPINLAQFAILTKSKVYALNLDKEETAMLAEAHKSLLDINGYDPVVIDGARDEIGIVTVLDGPPSGELVQPAVGTDSSNVGTFHHAFQAPDAFIRAGGFKGRQYQVLVDGSYYINRMFATVELISKLVIPVGKVGVIVSNFGRGETPGQAGATDDVNDKPLKHGRLVGDDAKGVRRNSLPPGKYPFNPYAGQVTLVPTTNTILLWQKGETSEHNLDARLKEVRLITLDAFEPDLPLSVVLHVDPQKASSVVQRFGNLDQLVNQTLDPLVSSYFKNVAQGKTATSLVHDRMTIQNEAKEHLTVEFAKYDLELVDVVLGTPTGSSIEPVLEQMRASQIAKEQVKAYEDQKLSAAKLRELNEEQARAQQQSHLTQSSIEIEIAENNGQAEVRRANREAEKIKALAQANAEAAKLQGQGEGERLASIGRGEAEATRARFEAAGGADYGLTLAAFERVADAVREAKLPIVPSTLITSSGTGGNALLQLFELLVAQKLTSPTSSATTPGDGAVQRADGHA